MAGMSDERFAERFSAAFMADIAEDPATAAASRDAIYMRLRADLINPYGAEVFGRTRRLVDTTVGDVPMAAESGVGFIDTIADIAKVAATAATAYTAYRAAKVSVEATRAQARAAEAAAAAPLVQPPSAEEQRLREAMAAAQRPTTPGWVVPAAIVGGVVVIGGIFLATR